jgi:hypothetical protein
MRITKLGGHIEFEVLVVLDEGVTELERHGVALLHDLLLKEGFNGGVQVFLHVLDQHGVTLADSRLEELQVLLLSEFKDLNVLFLAHSSDPLVGLTLWVDVEGPSSGLLGNDGVLN